MEHHASLGSTNDRAKALAREAGAVLPALIVADRQEAGRGRGSNRWWTGPGSLAFSLLADTQPWEVPRERMGMTALVAGIAVVEALSSTLEGHRLGLCWPNDVYVGDRKLAGILVEAPVENRLVVGVGINTNCRVGEAPEELAQRVATVVDLTGEIQDPTEVLMAWLDAWSTWIGRLAACSEEVGRRADALCLQQDQFLRLRQGKETWEGKCLGIAPDGAVRLETAQGVRSFYSGTVDFSESSGDGGSLGVRGVK